MKYILVFNENVSTNLMQLPSYVYIPVRYILTYLKLLLKNLFTIRLAIFSHTQRMLQYVMCVINE
jgi:hypothetical protein